MAQKEAKSKKGITGAKTNGQCKKLQKEIIRIGPKAW